MGARFVLPVMLAIAVSGMGAGELLARGGGHFGGGGRAGGGWSGGRSEFHGGDTERGGGSFERGGDRPGRRGEDFDRGAWQDKRGDHDRRHDGDRRHDNNNNNNNTTYSPNVNVYGNGWGNDDWGYGVAAGAITGMAMGAAIASADSQPTTVVVEQPTTVIQQTVTGAPAYGTQVATLPPGAQSRNVNGIVAYEASGVWYRPYFGANGVYYEVLPPPPAQPAAQSAQPK